MRVTNKTVEQKRDQRGEPHALTTLTIVGQFWQGPENPGETGHYRSLTGDITHARGRWGNCSAEYAQRHGLHRHVA